MIKSDGIFYGFCKTPIYKKIFILGIILGSFIPVWFVKFLFDENFFLFVAIFSSPLFLVGMILLVYFVSIPMNKTSLYAFEKKYSNISSMMKGCWSIYTFMIMSIIIFMIVKFIYDIPIAHLQLIVVIIEKILICIANALLFITAYGMIFWLPDRIKAWLEIDYSYKYQEIIDLNKNKEEIK